MVGQPVVLLTVPFENLLLMQLETAMHLGIRPLRNAAINPFKHKHLLTPPDILRIGQIGTTLAKREIINGIQQIRFPHAVIPQQTIYVGRKTELRLADILIVKYR